MHGSFPQLLNVRRVPECDLKAYYGEIDRQEAKFHAQLEGALPEDF